jgi:hypothetical protein
LLADELVGEDPLLHGELAEVLHHEERLRTEGFLLVLIFVLIFVPPGGFCRRRRLVGRVGLHP